MLRAYHERADEAAEGIGTTMEERLQKIIARSGLTSRRAAEEFITAGRVRVNGRIVNELGAKADPRKDKIEVDGTRLVAEPPVYIVLHKPKNVVSTLNDPEGRPTVAEYVRNAGARVYPIGRLDFATSGVLLMTNDGDFSNAMLHPKGGVPKTYVVKVHGVMDDEDAQVWRKGVELEDGKTMPADVRIMRHEGDKTWMEVTLREGRNQQIRRMGEATRFPVMRLARLSFAGVTSEGLLPGKWRLLTLDELLEIKKQFGVPKRVRAAAGQSDIDRLEKRNRKPGAPRAHKDEERPKRPTRANAGAASEDQRPPRGRRDEFKPRASAASGGDDKRPPRGRRDEFKPRASAGASGEEKRNPRVRRDEPNAQRAPRSDSTAAPARRTPARNGRDRAARRDG